MIFLSNLDSSLHCNQWAQRGPATYPEREPRLSDLSGLLPAEPHSEDATASVRPT